MKKRINVFELENCNKPLSPKRIIKKAVRAVRNLAISSSIILSGMFLDHYLTHDAVKVVERCGRTEYSHPDKKTTHILNYLSGVDSLSRQEQFDLIKAEVKADNYEGDRKTLNLDEMDEDDFYRWTFENISNEYGWVSIEEIRETAEDFVPRKRNYDHSLYEILWKAEVATGAPYLRWKGISRDFFNPFLYLYSSNAYYSPFTNKAYISLDDSEENLFGELSHSKQFNDNPLSFYFRGIESIVRVVGRVLSGLSINESYEKEYFTPGSLEYEAHEVIEPKLRKPFDNS